MFLICIFLLVLVFLLVLWGLALESFCTSVWEESLFWESMVRIVCQVHELEACTIDFVSPNSIIASKLCPVNEFAEALPASVFLHFSAIARSHLSLS